MSGSPVFTHLLILKMTASRAVETSVTSNNSLSQDYTNLDDQLSQTCQNTSIMISIIFMFPRNDSRKKLAIL